MLINDRNRMNELLDEIRRIPGVGMVLVLTDFDTSMLGMSFNDVDWKKLGNRISEMAINELDDYDTGDINLECVENLIQCYNEDMKK